MEFKDIIQLAMFEMNLNQDKIARLFEVNQTTVSQWILGKKKPGYDNIVKICEVLVITPNQFFGVEEIPDTVIFGKKNGH